MRHVTTIKRRVRRLIPIIRLATRTTSARAVLTLTLLVASVATWAAPAVAANVVLLVMDDTAASDVAGMPTLRQLAREGTTFDHAYSPSPMCAPGRAIIQTGLYSQNNGVTQNGVRQFVANGDLTRTFAFDLHNAGDDTRFVGKYINGAPPLVPGWNP